MAPAHRLISERILPYAIDSIWPQHPQRPPLLVALVAGPPQASEVSQYLPDGTVVVVSFNFKQLMEAPLLKADEKAFKEGMNGFAKGIEGFGVDPNKDIKRVVLQAVWTRKTSSSCSKANSTLTN